MDTLSGCKSMLFTSESAEVKRVHDMKPLREKQFLQFYIHEAEVAS